jgi:hypothetical protein
MLTEERRRRSKVSGLCRFYFSIALGLWLCRASGSERAADLPPTFRATLPPPGLEQGPAELDFVEHQRLEVWRRR